MEAETREQGSDSSVKRVPNYRTNRKNSGAASGGERDLAEGGGGSGQLISSETTYRKFGDSP